MPNKTPRNITILQLLGANFPRKRPVRPVKYILRCDFNFPFQVLARNEEV